MGNSQAAERRSRIRGLASDWDGGADLAPAGEAPGIGEAGALFGLGGVYGAGGFALAVFF